MSSFPKILLLFDLIKKTLEYTKLLTLTENFCPVKKIWVQTIETVRNGNALIIRMYVFSSNYEHVLSKLYVCNNAVNIGLLIGSEIKWFEKWRIFRS